MKRTFLVLALALLFSAGCRTMGPHCGQSCGNDCNQCCEPCHVMTARNAPRPGGCCEGYCDTCGRGGNMEANCPGGDGCVFDRYCGSDCGPGYPDAPYDCSPCNSCDWGCTGHRHPNGYVTGRECHRCSTDNCNGQQYCVCPKCHHTYCCLCGPAAPGCCCPFCGCGPSGDQFYNFNPGPPVAQTAYPYYTLRGPRDFLLNNPPSLGPY